MDPFYTDEILAMPVPAGCKRLVVGRGSKTPGVIFVGEAPGSEEDETGLPFVGKSGKLLDAWIARWELAEEDYAVLNTVKFFPQNAEGHPRPPTEKEKDAWRPLLLKQLLALKPKIIIAVGSTALKELTDSQEDHLKACGALIPLRKFYLDVGCQVVGMPHPAFLLRNGGHIEDERDPIRNKFVRQTFQLIHEALHRPKMLVIDIETNSVNVNDAKMLYFGAYSYVDKKGYVFQTPFEIQELIDRHTHLVGFNNKEFDQKIMANNGIFLFNKVTVDMYQGLRARGRKEDMGLKDLRDNKLDTLVRYLKLGEKKEFDLEILRKNRLSTEEHRQVVEYLQNDVIITTKLFDWWTNWTAPFAQYVSRKHQWRQTYKTCSSASYAYKAICHATGLPEIFKEDDDVADDEEEDSFEGGFVSADIEVARGKLLLFDFASLYPHNFFQGNLFSPVPIPQDYEGEAFRANEFYPELKGVYKVDKLGKIETVLKNFYLERVKFKKAKDPRQYALKILLNASYGAASSDKFVSIHNPTIGPDTTYMGRQNIKYVRKKLLEAGFILCMSDTDSCVLQIPEGKTEEEAVKVINECVAEIKRWLPFPSDTFGMVLEKHIKYFQMFKHKKTGVLLKKFYLFVTDENEVVVKGLPIVKSNSTGLGKKIYEMLKPKIIESLQCKFSESYFDELMKALTKDDIALAAKRFKVKQPSEYKSPSQLDCQIAQRYGPGNHWLIRNKIVGAGMKVKYGKVEEVKNIGIEFIDFTLTKEELHYFVRSGLEGF